MGDVINSDVVRVACKFLMGGVDRYVNVFHLHYITLASVSDANYMSGAAGYLDTVYGGLNSILPNDLSYESIEFYNETQDRPMGEVGWPTQTNGSASSEYLPEGCCGLVTFPTAAKRTFGRKFLGPITEGAVADGKLTSGTIALLVAFAANFLGTMAMGTAGNNTAGTYRRSDSRYEAFVEALVRALIAYQRRRKPGVGG